MNAIIRITSTLENSIFGQFNGIYLGDTLNLNHPSEGKESVKLTVNKGDNIIIDYKPIESFLNKFKTKLEINEDYDVNFIGYITGGNKNNPATITLTGFNFSYSGLEGE